MEKINVAHLVKSEDLNHHGTLFAGRMAEWFVEACFICAAKVTEKPQNVVCVNIHGLTFTQPGNKGDIINMETSVAKAGRTSFTVYGKITKNNSDHIVSDGFVTFVFVDENGKTTPHNITMDEAKSSEEIAIRERAKNLR
ncbi:acyl-CoA thioesterase [Sporanaerobacter acetigenes]|uniref:acyl-CoA thioesterase n=1 Tax=Sporanaerobacter acetigenes TaxID=165813 RepID=UPI00331E39C0